MLNPAARPSKTAEGRLTPLRVCHDLAHLDVVERHGLLLDGLRDAICRLAGSTFRLEHEHRQAGVARSRPISSDEARGLLYLGNHVVPQALRRLFHVLDADSHDDCMHSISPSFAWRAPGLAGAEHTTFNDITEGARKQGIAHLSQLPYVVLETDGTLSFLQRSG